jgi:hypothetical protein
MEVAPITKEAEYCDVTHIDVRLGTFLNRRLAATAVGERIFPVRGPAAIHGPGMKWLRIT